MQFFAMISEVIDFYHADQLPVAVAVSNRITKVELRHHDGRFGTEEQRQAFLPELTSMVHEFCMHLVLLIILIY